MGEPRARVLERRRMQYLLRKQGLTPAEMSLVIQEKYNVSPSVVARDWSRRPEWVGDVVLLADADIHEFFADILVEIEAQRHRAHKLEKMAEEAEIPFKLTVTKREGKETITADRIEMVPVPDLGAMVKVEQVRSGDIGHSIDVGKVAVHMKEGDKGREQKYTFEEARELVEMTKAVLNERANKAIDVPYTVVADVPGVIEVDDEELEAPILETKRKPPKRTVVPEPKPDLSPEERMTQFDDILGG